MADSSVLNQAIKFRYGSIDRYNEQVAAGRIDPKDVYFVVADDSTNGFLYLNGQAFGAGVLDVSVSEVVDSSFNITITKINKDNGAVEDDVINIPFSDPEEYAELVERVASLESSVGGLESSVGDLRDDVDGLKDKMAQLFGSDPEHEYPDGESDGILQALTEDIVDVSILADELNASVQDHEDRITDLEASVASLDASVTNIYQEFYPVVERVETLETSVNTIETKVETLETTVETIVEHSVGEIGAEAEFNYDFDSSHLNVQAQNAIDVVLDGSNNASLGVFVDNTYVKLKTVTDASGNSHDVITVDAQAIGAAAGEVPEYFIEKLQTPDASCISQYRLTTQDGLTKGAVIDIPKDFLVKDAALYTVPDGSTGPDGNMQPGDKYIDFVINTKDSSTAAGDEHLYLLVSDLVDAYTIANDSSKYLDINAQNEISFDADEVVKYVDSSLKVTEKFTQVDGSISDISTRLNTLDGTVSDLSDTVTDLSTNVYRTDFIDASYAALNSSISAMELKWLEI